jgi:putative flippase GtrA
MTSQKRRLRDSARATYHRHRRSFSRANVTALIATVVDVGTLTSLVELAHVYYVIATALGAFCGAITNFTLNRLWAFRDGRHTVRLHAQGLRYALVSAGSLVLNTALVFCFTEFGQLRYLVSKAIAAIIVGWGWNYPLHRHFVFPAAAKDKKDVDEGQHQDRVFG